MQSTITLKFRDEPAKQIARKKVSVEQKFLDRFDAEYLANCDNKNMNFK